MSNYRGEAAEADAKLGEHNEFVAGGVKVKTDAEVEAEAHAGAEITDSSVSDDAVASVGAEA